MYLSDLYLLYFFQMNFVRSYVFVCVIWTIVLVASWPELIEQPSFILDFHLSLFSFNLYSSLLTLLAIKLPSVYYLIFDQVTYHTFITIAVSVAGCQRSKTDQ